MWPKTILRYGADAENYHPSLTFQLSSYLSCLGHSSLKRLYKAGVPFLIFLLFSCPIWGDGFQLPKMNEQQLSSFSPEEWTFVEVIYPNKLPQIRVFVEDGWKTPEEAAKIAEKRRSFGTFPKYVRSSILADYRICPICLITSKTDSEFIQHLLVELSKEIDALKVEANRKPKSVVWYDKDSNAQTVPQLTLAELDKIPKEIIKEGAIVCVPETAFSDKFFRIFQKGEWQVATNEEVLKSWKPEYKESPPMHSP